VSKVSSTLPPPVCADFSFPVYFGTSADRLSEAALQVVRDAALRVRGCALGRIDVVGLADAGGSAGGNLALSRRRAAAVATALAGAGLPRPVFDVDAVGDSGATTPAGDPEPLRRRTEVVIRAAPPPPAAAPRP
jgi:outer membrane protein OmpA-like peptidoglycan-associated protein